MDRSPARDASPLCPVFGVTFGWCVEVAHAGDGASLHVGLGDAHGPRAASDSTLALADLDGDGGPDPTWTEHAEAQPCPVLMVMMVLPVDPPFWPCAQGADLGGSLDL
ncbi:MAG: hypothetical protein LC624_04025 [Halobacteriales archaeon]|nr:hypothetical protein [Halobacteriales archaeon]